ncbi:hypothetical protein BVX98_03865, partial [bacterium F11]
AGNTNPELIPDFLSSLSLKRRRIVRNDQSKRELFQTYLDRTLFNVNQFFSEHGYRLVPTDSGDYKLNPLPPSGTRNRTWSSETWFNRTWRGPYLVPFVLLGIVLGIPLLGETGSSLAFLVPAGVLPLWDVRFWRDLIVDESGAVTLFPDLPDPKREQIRQLIMQRAPSFETLAEFVDNRHAAILFAIYVQGKTIEEYTVETDTDARVITGRLELAETKFLQHERISRSDLIPGTASQDAPPISTTSPSLATVPDGSERDTIAAGDESSDSLSEEPFWVQYKRGEQKEVVQRWFDEGLSFDEVRARTGWTENTFRRRLGYWDMDSEGADPEKTNAIQPEGKDAGKEKVSPPPKVGKKKPDMSMLDSVPPVKLPADFVPRPLADYGFVKAQLRELNGPAVGVFTDKDVLEQGVATVLHRFPKPGLQTIRRLMAMGAFHHRHSDGSFRENYLIIPSDLDLMACRFNQLFLAENPYGMIGFRALDRLEKLKGGWDKIRVLVTKTRADLLEQGFSEENVFHIQLELALLGLALKEGSPPSPHINKKLLLILLPLISTPLSVGLLIPGLETLALWGIQHVGLVNYAIMEWWQLGLVGVVFSLAHLAELIQVAKDFDRSWMEKAGIIGTRLVTKAVMGTLFVWLLIPPDGWRLSAGSHTILNSLILFAIQLGIPGFGTWITPFSTRPTPLPPIPDNVAEAVQNMKAALEKDELDEIRKALSGLNSAAIVWSDEEDEVYPGFARALLETNVTRNGKEELMLTVMINDLGNSDRVSLFLTFYKLLVRFPLFDQPGLSSRLATLVGLQASVGKKKLLLHLYQLMISKLLAEMVAQPDNRTLQYEGSYMFSDLAENAWRAGKGTTKGKVAQIMAETSLGMGPDTKPESVARRTVWNMGQTSDPELYSRAQDTINEMLYETIAPEVKAPFARQIGEVRFETESGDWDVVDALVAVMENPFRGDSANGFNIRSRAYQTVRKLAETRNPNIIKSFEETTTRRGNTAVQLLVTGLYEDGIKGIMSVGTGQTYETDCLSSARALKALWETGSPELRRQIRNATPNFQQRFGDLSPDLNAEGIIQYLSIRLGTYVQSNLNEVLNAFGSTDVPALDSEQLNQDSQPDNAASNGVNGKNLLPVILVLLLTPFFLGAMEGTSLAWWISSFLNGETLSSLALLIPAGVLPFVDEGDNFNRRTLFKGSGVAAGAALGLRNGSAQDLIPTGERRFDFPPRAQDQAHDFIYHDNGPHTRRRHFDNRIPFMRAAMEDARVGEIDGATKFVLWQEDIVEFGELIKKMKDLVNSRYSRRSRSIQREIEKAYGLRKPELEQLYAFGLRFRDADEKGLSDLIRLFKDETSVLPLRLFVKGQSYLLKTTRNRGLTDPAMGYASQVLKFADKERLDLLFEEESGKAVQLLVIAHYYQTLSNNALAQGKFEEAKTHSNNAIRYNILRLQERARTNFDQIKKLKEEHPSWAIFCLKGISHRYEHLTMEQEGYRVVINDDAFDHNPTPTTELYESLLRGNPLDRDKKNLLFAHALVIPKLIEWKTPANADTYAELSRMIVNGENPDPNQPDIPPLSVGDIRKMVEFIGTEWEQTEEKSDFKFSEKMQKWMKNPENGVHWMPTYDEAIEAIHRDVGPDKKHIYSSSDYHITKEHFDRRMPFINDVVRKTNERGANLVIWSESGIKWDQFKLEMERLSKGVYSRRRLAKLWNVSEKEYQVLYQFSQDVMAAISQGSTAVLTLLKDERTLSKLDLYVKGVMYYWTTEWTENAERHIGFNEAQRAFASRMKAPIHYQQWTGKMLKHFILYDLSARFSKVSFYDGEFKSARTFGAKAQDELNQWMNERLKTKKADIDRIKRIDPDASVLIIEGTGHRLDCKLMKEDYYEVTQDKKTLDQDALFNWKLYEDTIKDEKMSQDNHERTLRLSLFDLFYNTDPAKSEPYTILSWEILNGINPLTGEKEKKLSVISSDAIRQMSLDLGEKLIEERGTSVESEDQFNFKKLAAEYMQLWLKETKIGTFWIPEFDEAIRRIKANEPVRNPPPSAPLQEAPEVVTEKTDVSSTAIPTTPEEKYKEVRKFWITISVIGTVIAAFLSLLGWHFHRRNRIQGPPKIKFSLLIWLGLGTVVAAGVAFDATNLNGLSFAFLPFVPGRVVSRFIDTGLPSSEDLALAKAAESESHRRTFLEYVADAFTATLDREGWDAPTKIKKSSFDEDAWKSVHRDISLENKYSIWERLRYVVSGLSPDQPLQGGLTKTLVHQLLWLLKRRRVKGADDQVNQLLQTIADVTRIRTKSEKKEIQEAFDRMKNLLGMASDRKIGLEVYKGDATAQIGNMVFDKGSGTYTLHVSKEYLDKHIVKRGTGYYMNGKRGAGAKLIRDFRLHVFIANALVEGVMRKPDVDPEQVRWALFLEGLGDDVIPLDLGQKRVEEVKELQFKKQSLIKSSYLQHIMEGVGRVLRYRYDLFEKDQLEKVFKTLEWYDAKKKPSTKRSQPPVYDFETIHLDKDAEKAIAMKKDGEDIFFTDIEDGIGIYQAETGEQIAAIHIPNVTTLALSSEITDYRDESEPETKRFLAVGTKGGVHLVDVTDPRLPLMPDKIRSRTTREPGEIVEMYEAGSTSKSLEKIPSHGSVTHLTFYDSGDKLVFATSNNEIRLWDLKTGQQVSIQKEDKDREIKHLWVKDENIYTIEADGTVSYWAKSRRKGWDNREEKRVVSEGHEVSAATADSSGQRLILATKKGSRAQIEVVEVGRVPYTSFQRDRHVKILDHINPYDSSIDELVLSPDGEWLQLQIYGYNSWYPMKKPRTELDITPNEDWRAPGIVKFWNGRIVQIRDKRAIVGPLLRSAAAILILVVVASLIGNAAESLQLASVAGSGLILDLDSLLSDTDPTSAEDSHLKRKRKRAETMADIIMAFRNRQFQQLIPIRTLGYDRMDQPQFVAEGDVLVKVADWADDEKFLGLLKEALQGHPNRSISEKEIEEELDLWIAVFLAHMLRSENPSTTTSDIGENYLYVLKQGNQTQQSSRLQKVQLLSGLIKNGNKNNNITILTDSLSHGIVQEALGLLGSFRNQPNIEVEVDGQKGEALLTNPYLDRESLEDRYGVQSLIVAPSHMLNDHISGIIAWDQLVPITIQSLENLGRILQKILIYA